MEDTVDNQELDPTTQLQEESDEEPENVSFDTPEDTVDNQELDPTTQSQEESDEEPENVSFDTPEDTEDRLMFLRSNNPGFYLGFKAYHGEADYTEAINKFQSAISYEDGSSEAFPEHTDNDEAWDVERLNTVIAKSMYWQAECHVKIGQFTEAIEIFTQLSSLSHTHYLGLAADRRVKALGEHYERQTESS